MAEETGQKTKRGGMLAALIPGMLALLGPLAAAAGGLAWLCPVAALPVGLLLCKVWEPLGVEGLPRGLGSAFGPWVGKILMGAYLGWSVVLLVWAAGRYADRWMSVTPNEEARWLILAVGLGLCLWLGRGKGVALVRAGEVFLLWAGAALAFALLLSLPALDWKNLWPPEGAHWAGIPAGLAAVLSLNGLGIYGLCLPAGDAAGGSFRKTIAGCGVFGWLILTVIGALGPALAARGEEPFLLLLQGVAVPGAFRRGEAALMAALTLADWGLLSLLIWAGRSLWRELDPGLKGWGYWLPAAGAFLAAGVFSKQELQGALFENWLVIGNLIFGIGVPTAAFLLKWGKRSMEKNATCSGSQKQNQ